MTWSSRNYGFSHVVEFTVDPIHMPELVASLMSRIEHFTCSCPGFIRACVQVSDEGDRALMQLLWSSREHGEQALERAQRLELDLFHMACQPSAKALLFSSFNVVAQVQAQRLST
ncbi:antibiotic biosynthesis monooxygenase [Pseudomonas lini]